MGDQTLSDLIYVHKSLTGGGMFQDSDSRLVMTLIKRRLHEISAAHAQADSAKYNQSVEQSAKER